MAVLPGSRDSLLVRTCFTDDADWELSKAAVVRENRDGFRAYCEPVNHPELDGWSWPALRTAALESGSEATVMFVVDEVTLASDELPILVVHLAEPVQEPFRCVASELWAVDHHLNLGDATWAEFADAADPDGIYRGR